jgi:hypothetical protein
MEVSGQLHASAGLIPRERAPVTHWIGGWVGPRAILNAMNILNNKSRTADNVWSSSLGLDVELITPHRKKSACYEMLHRASELAGSCEYGNEPSGFIKGGEFLD